MTARLFFLPALFFLALASAMEVALTGLSKDNDSPSWVLPTTKQLCLGTHKGALWLPDGEVMERTLYMSPHSNYHCPLQYMMLQGTTVNFCNGNKTLIFI